MLYWAVRFWVGTEEGVLASVQTGKRRDAAFLHRTLVKLFHIFMAKPQSFEAKWHQLQEFLV